MPRKRRGNKHRAFIRSVKPAVYTELLEAQGGCCALCGNRPRTRALNIDHDHRTMEIRGLLCGMCNRDLPDGRDAAWMRRAADYIEGSWDAPEVRQASGQ
jgi:hypothetical protein